ncbi:hypothetical protein B4N89_46490 [Embleya scabrispora]|uniref:DUF4238 domain-containing protein n=2 Tax=Embleya scabrispora TaxID=159449 RepID=A0A1T3NI05_9ACTN|nr:hypothetical protein B4N89_46490 [Embleya scabrispora]
MYLRRFAERRPGRKGQFTLARNVDAMDSPFEVNVRNVASVKGFHWAVAPDGTEHHLAERLMTRIETAATPVFSTILDDSDYALPRRWPLRENERARMSWWIAAQLLRTKRQRRRVNHMIDASEGVVPAPAGVRSFAANNPHLDFIARHLGALAGVVHRRPWGVGFSTACLITGDVPAVILNGHDAPDQVLAAAYWDIVLPLDPHRFLILPGVATIDEPAKHLDHRLVLPGGIGLLLSQIVHDAAESQVFQHPDHTPFPHFRPSGPRLPAPESNTRHEGPRYLLNYDVLASDLIVERRWAQEHPPPREGPPENADAPIDPRELVGRLSSALDARVRSAPPAAIREQ